MREAVSRILRRWTTLLTRAPTAVAPLSGRVLVVGHFSTIGDLEALRIVEAWLRQSGRPCDLAPYSPAIGPALDRWVDWRQVDAAAYSEVVFVCGPMIPKDRLRGFYSRFAHCRLYGVNLSMVDSLNGFDPFTRLWPRDRGLNGIPDLSFLHMERMVPAVGICLAPSQSEYGDRQRHAVVEQAVESFLSRKELCVLRIDTRVPHRRNFTGMGTVDALSTLVRKCDVVVTSRLHGLVLALKHGIPVVAIDPIAGGQKVLAQARALEWPHACEAQALTPAWLEAAFEACSAEEARALARECASQAVGALEIIRREFLETFQAS